MSKISKKDQDPNQVHSDRAKLEALMARRSEHFRIGTRVVMAGMGAGEIIGIRRCKCRQSETELQIDWDDPYVGVTWVKPFALNRS